MCNKKGFSLIEAMIAVVCLAVGVVGVSSMFAYATRTNMYAEQVTTGTLLANSKAEELGAQMIPNLPLGGGLDPASPTTNYFEYINVASDGTVTTSDSDSTFPYLRMWQIAGSNPRLITVSVVTMASGMSGQRVELVRTTTLVTN